MTTLSLITLNCFGVPIPPARWRLLALTRELNKRAVSVVCLQEVQAHVYRRLLINACTSYPGNAFAPFVHAPRGGLLTLTQLPIVHSHFTRYQERGRWYTPTAADRFLHKGVLRTELLLDQLPVIVLNTHLNANYSGDWSPTNRYARDEWQQLQQLARIVSDQPSEALVLVAGDFNIPRGSWLYHQFLTASGLNDPLANDNRPTYRIRPGIPARYARPIDFALWRAPALPGLRVDSDICFKERVPLALGRQGHLSDHYGIEMQLTWDHHPFIHATRGTDR